MKGFGISLSALACTLTACNCMAKGWWPTVIPLVGMAFGFAILAYVWCRAGSDMKYPQVHDSEWVQPVRRGYKMMCCDCSLVHVINFRIRKGHVQLQASRDNRATAAARRRKGKKL